MGDFYEMFFEDAKTASRILDITLTTRGGANSHIPLAGIPYHSAEPYITRLIKSNLKVAVCEQMEDPRHAKGIVKREVVRIISPGSVMEDGILDSRANNYIMCIYPADNRYGIALADISTGEFTASVIDSKLIFNELSRISPSEIILPASAEKAEIYDKLKNLGIMINCTEEHSYWYDNAERTLKNQFNLLSLDGFGLDDKLCISAAGALLSYLKDIQKNNLIHITKIKRHYPERYMYIDSATKRNLEILSNVKNNSRHGTLLEVIDKTVTTIGARLLKRWLLQPLTDVQEIRARIEAVEELKSSNMIMMEIEEELRCIADIQRIIGRIAYGNSNPRGLLGLKSSLMRLPRLKGILAELRSMLLKDIVNIDCNESVVELIERSIKEDASSIVTEGNVIRQGYNSQLDELRSIEKDTRHYLAEIEEKEKRETGIKSLKVRYNRVFGYFIEVTKSNLGLVPSHYIRKQTQANSERYITEELKEKESIILSSRERICSLEAELFHGIVNEIGSHVRSIQELAEKIAILDCLLSYSKIALEYNYCKPDVNEGFSISIVSGRHAVVERLCNNFVSNDSILDENNSLILITGPNMAGKSTFLRQIALITLMAQCGSFVPAESASIGIVDRIFPRVGAYDDLAHGQSTFMVEMIETANILNNATHKSLVILDEIGRGTSTYDGVSLAWAIAEYIHRNINAKTLFATHYHHLNKLETQFSGIRNFNIAVHESGDEITFLHKIVPGGTDKSYGIQAARLAGIPQQVIERSREIMSMIEMEDELGDILSKGTDSDTIKEKIVRFKSGKSRKNDKDSGRQMALFESLSEKN